MLRPNDDQQKTPILQNAKNWRQQNANSTKRMIWRPTEQQLYKMHKKTNNITPILPNAQNDDQQNVNSIPNAQNENQQNANSTKRAKPRSTER